MAKTASKSMRNWQHYPSSKWYKIDQKMWFWIWHSAVAIWCYREKQQYRCTTTVPPVRNCQKYFGKFTSYM